MEDKIGFLVTGHTGEYSDRSEWAVGVFPTRELAQDYVHTLTLAYQQSVRGDKRERKMRKLDPSFYEDYTGTSYYVGEVRLFL